MKKIIFDLGFNNGQNLKYFLLKADIVVGVEANPTLFCKVKNLFAAEIANKQLFLENAAVSELEGFGNFYINQKFDFLSTLSPEILNTNEVNDLQIINIKLIRASELVRKYLNKFNLTEIEFIKIDVEGYDHIILQDLFNNKIWPKFLSAEVSNSKVISLILDSPYKSFKFIEGKEIGNKIKNINICQKNNQYIMHDFKEHSSGPYGQDAPGNYFKKDDIINYFLNNGLGWRDIFASLNIENYENSIRYNYIHSSMGFKYHFSRSIISFFKMIMYRLKKLFY
jgi:FkbM family methyltransferase